MVKYLLILAAMTSAAVTPVQILMEEPGRTNRSAQAWLDDNVPITSDVALKSRIPAVAYRLAYSNGLSVIPGILGASTERFSTNWSYRFRNGGGVGADVVEVRNDLTSYADPLIIDNINTRFLVVTNRGTYGNFTSESISLTAPRTNLSSVTTVGGGTTVFSLRSPVVSSPLSDLTISAPAVLFLNEPVIPAASGVVSNTNYPPMSVFNSAGMFNVGTYVDNLMWLARTNTGWFTANVLQSIGMDNVYPNVVFSVNGGNEPADWAHIPVLTTLRNTEDVYYDTDWWEYSQDDMIAAYGDMTNAVYAIFSSTGGVTDVIGFTNELALIEASPSPVVSTSLYAWGLTNKYGDIRSAVSVYLAAAAIQFNVSRGDGVVCVADDVSSGYVDFHRYHHMAVNTTALMRVSVSMHFTNSAALSAETARYWLVAGNDKILTKRVSSAGERGPAFTLTGPATSVSGYLFLDLSEMVQVHSNALRSAWYYVKFEELKGFDTWQD